MPSYPPTHPPPTKHNPGLRTATPYRNRPDPCLQAGGRPLLTIHLQYGLAERIRAFLSACSVAAATGRHLHVFWESDDAVPVGFTDLFEAQGNFTVLPLPLPVNTEDYDVYNYMEVWCAFTGQEGP